MPPRAATWPGWAPHAASPPVRPLPIPNLPNQPVGREEELAAFFAALPRRPVLLVHGLPGIGKTFFLLQLAEQVAGGKAAGIINRVIYLEIRDGWQYATVLDHLNAAIAPPDIDETEPTRPSFSDFTERMLSTIERLETGRYLILIDDFQRLDRSIHRDFINLARRYLRHSHIAIATTSELELPTIDRLDLWEVRLGEFGKTESRRLFLELLGDRRSSRVSPADLRAVFASTGGHPFTIRMLASCHASHRTGIGDLVAASTPWSKEVQSWLLARIFRQLSPGERALLALLQCSRGLIRPDAMPRLFTPAVMAAHIGSLQRKLLLDLTSTGELRVHSTVRAHARRIFRERDLRAHHRRWAEHCQTSLDRGVTRPRVEILIDLVHHRIHAGDLDLAIEVMTNHLDIWYRQGRFDELMRLLEDLETAGAALPPHLAVMKAKILYSHGRLRESRALLLPLAVKAPAWLQPRVWCCLGHIDLCRNRVERANRRYRRAQQLARAQNLPNDEAELFIYRASVARFQGRFDRAGRLLLRSIRLSLAQGDVETATAARMARAELLTATGQYTVARAIYRAAARTFRGIHHRGGLAEVAHQQTLLAFRCGRMGKARRLLPRARRACERAQQVWRAVQLRLLEGKLHYLRREIKQATMVLEDAVSRADDLAQEEVLADGMLYLTRIHLDAGRIDQAIASLPDPNPDLDASVNARIHLVRAVARWRQQRPRLALAALAAARRAIRRQPTHPLLHVIDEFASAFRDALAPDPTDTTSEVPRCRHGLPQERRAGARQDGAHAPARLRKTPVSRRATGPTGSRFDGISGGDGSPAQSSSGSRSALPGPGPRKAATDDEPSSRPPDARRTLVALSPEERSLLDYLPVRDRRGPITHQILTLSGELLSDLAAAQRIFMEPRYEIAFDNSTGLLRLGGQPPIDLSGRPRLRRMLALFIRHPGQRLALDHIYRSVWGEAFDPESHFSTLRSAIARLRRLLEPAPVDGKFRYLKRSDDGGEYFFAHDVEFCLIEPVTDPPR